MLNTLSVTQFLGQIVTEAEYYRCDAFILMERICKELMDYDDCRNDEIDCIIASRKCGFEWIFTDDCDGKSYNWQSILHNEKLNHIYICNMYWDRTPFGWERQIKFTEINRDAMVRWMEYHKSVNDNVKEIKELIEIGD